MEMPTKHFWSCLLHEIEVFLFICCTESLFLLSPMFYGLAELLCLRTTQRAEIHQVNAKTMTEKLHP